MSEIERAIAYWEEFEREIDEMPHSEILEAQREPVRTALRILRAELDREKNPLTWNERINQMTLEEKAEAFPMLARVNERARRYAMKKTQFGHVAIRLMDEYSRKWLASPYTEGEKE